MPEQLKAADFNPHLHTTFRIHYAPDAAIEAELIEVAERPPTPRQERFSIVFRGPRWPLLLQALYRIEHPTLGTHELFISPFEVDDDSAYYEAVFNYRLPVSR